MGLLLGLLCPILDLYPGDPSSTPDRGSSVSHEVGARALRAEDLRRAIGRPSVEMPSGWTQTVTDSCRTSPGLAAAVQQSGGVPRPGFGRDGGSISARVPPRRRPGGVSTRRCSSSGARATSASRRWRRRLGVRRQRDAVFEREVVGDDDGAFGRGFGRETLAHDVASAVPGVADPGGGSVASPDRRLCLDGLARSVQALL